MSDILDNAPGFSVHDAEQIVRDLYKIEAGADLLTSERDQNFKITDKNKNEYVLKIANALEDYNFLDMQNQAMDLLTNSIEKSICPAVFVSLNGKKNNLIKGYGQKTHFVRLLNFIPGTFISGLENISDNLLVKLGNEYALIDKALMNFSHHSSHRYFHWDIKNVADTRKHFHLIKNKDRRKIAEHFVVQYQTFVMPLIPAMRTSIIHNDGNDNNVLLNNYGLEDYPFSIIDFGDMVNTFLINELAVVIAYLIFNKPDPVEVAAKVVSGYNKNISLNKAEIEALFYLIASRLTISVAMSAYQYSRNPENEYLRVSEKQAWDALEKLISINPDNARNVFFDACGKQRQNLFSTGHQNLVERRKAVLGKSLSISYKQPLKIIRGLGQYLFDEDGKRYLDCVNNVCHVGHSHPGVVKAAQRQIALLNTNTRYLHDNIVAYAEKLLSKFPEHLNKCFFVCSGSEANELALRMAKTFTNQDDMIVVDHAYHGNTSSLINISAYKFNGPGGRGKPDNVHIIGMPDGYRGIFKYHDPEIGLKYACDAESVINKLKSAGKMPAGFIAESLAGVGGQIVFPDNYLNEVYRIVRDAGGVCIADEVQVGFGRMGSHFWGFETQNVLPDIVTLGKPIGNGHPLAAVITTEEIADAFANGMEYFNTFGGNPVSCAIGLEVLNVIEEEKLQENSMSVGDYLLNKIEELKYRYELIGDVRGKGLFIGIELVKNRETLEPAAEEASILVEEMKNRQVLLSTDGPLHNVIKFKPPIVFDKHNADELLEKLDDEFRKFS